jgi:hypothetical protein
MTTTTLSTLTGLHEAIELLKEVEECKIPSYSLRSSIRLWLPILQEIKQRDLAEMETQLRKLGADPVRELFRGHEWPRVGD